MDPKILRVLLLFVSIWQRYPVADSGMEGELVINYCTLPKSLINQLFIGLLFRKERFEN
jgi:hypothetical protein